MRSACGAEFQNYMAYIYETVSVSIIASVKGDFDFACAVVAVLSRQYARYQSIAYLDNFAGAKDLTAHYFPEKGRAAADEYIAENHPDSERTDMSEIESIAAKFLKRCQS